uniref:Trafficking protein particle complex subunit n=1 Tax=Amphiprion ocellaris TaxID=80972 RepID=A0A3Q1CL90_AMPOC
MVIFSVYVVNKAGGLIYQYDNYVPRAEVEKTFSYPLDLVLKHHDEKVVVSFGQRDGIRVGHAVLSINGVDVVGKNTSEGKDILEYLKDPSNYPVSIRFGRARLSSNEKLMLASMFHSLFAIGSQLSPEAGSSGIEMLETDVFKLHCFQTLTVSNNHTSNPCPLIFRCELFDQNLKSALEVAEKAGNFGAGS